MTEMLVSPSQPGATVVSQAANSSGFLDSEFRYHLFPAFYGIILILGFFANLYVLFILHYLRQAKAMGEIRIYMINLTIADLLFVCVLPFWVGYYSRRGDWIYSDFMCRLTGSMFFINTYCSILFLGAISVNRYWAVTQPLNAASSDHRHRGIAVSVAIWVMTIAMAVPYLVSPGFRSGTVASKKSNMSFSGKRPRGVKRRALQMLCAVVGVFVVCFLPHHVIQGLWTLAVLDIKEGWGSVDWGQETRQALNDAHQITLVLMGLNCILDPVVYFFATRKFRNFIKAHVKKMGKGEGCSQTVTSQIESRNQSQRLHSDNQQLELN
ncbi:hypothetical protein LDENG_00038810 [Lucifuga dentata]|nr:hypothetical protein LDENG_00038810 [Lucifuga dentata]